MTKILVVGLLPGQAAQVARDCKAFAVQLKFVESRHNGGIRGDGAHCILTKFVNHSHTIKALAQFPRDRVHYNRGGLNELVKTIAGIADGRIVRGARHPMHITH